MDKSLLDRIKQNPTILHQLPPAVKVRAYELLEEIQERKSAELAQNHFMEFVKKVWPGFIHGAHHVKMAEAFEKVANGQCKRLIINMPPRHTKSEFASYLLPAWFLGKFPQKKVIQTSHTAELAVGFGRKVRNLVDSDPYKAIFPDTSLQADSKAAGRWNTSKGGDYFAIGVGGAVTGKGADILIIDDPHSEQEAALAESDPEIYDKTYEWYTSGPRQRLQPGGAIIIVMCMTGDTPVMLADGSEKPLAEIRAGDIVATFEEGNFTTATVTNWRSNGFDLVYQIQTQSGKILRANERHPFLVMNEGVLEWTRLNQLQVGDELVSLKGVIDRREQKPNPVCVAPAQQKNTTTENTLTPRENRLGTTASGGGLRAVWTAVKGKCLAVGYALNTTISNMCQNHPPRKTGGGGSNAATESLLSSTIAWFWSVIIYVMCVGSRLLRKIPVLIGAVSSVLTTATLRVKSVACFVMTVTSQSDTVRRQKFSKELQRISDFTTDPIVKITPDGVAEVFDLEVARTENFIANGFVSHNTRWSKKDLTGRVLKAAAQRGGEEWEVIEFPAILPSGKPLWPQFWPRHELEALKEELPHGKWMAQYMQNPTSDVTAIVKREWWQVWEHDDPPHCEFTLMSWDTAFEKSNRADYSALTTWGVFYKDDDTGTPQANIILLNAFRDRMEFPVLKKTALEQYKDWEPDSIIIEKKASGAPLIYEMRAMGIPVQEFTPTKGNDKIARLNAVSDLFASGRVWAPATQWAEEVIEEVASFPQGEYDDFVDSVSMALMRFRKGGFLRTLLDEEDEPQYFKRHFKGYY